ncbi:MAG: GGDEF domain-containing protein [Ilumatobacteraceae bacterium]
MTLRTSSRVIGTVGSLFAAGLLVVAATGPNDSGWLAVGAVAMLAADVTGCVTWGWSARRRHGLERAAFICLTAIFAIWTTAAVAWLVNLRRDGEIESLLIVQVGYIGVAVLGLASLILLYLHYRDHPGWEGPVDAGVVALSLTVLLWLIVVPVANSDGNAWLRQVGTSYLAVLGGLAVAVGGMVGWRGSVIHRWLRWVVAGSMLLAADIAVTIAAQPSREHVGLRLVGMAVGVLASTCLTVAALRREGVDDRPAADGGPAHIPRSRIRRVLPALAMLGAVSGIAFDHGAVGLIAIGAVVLLLVQGLWTLELVERLLDERSRWAATDALTGAYNRRQLDAELPVLLARAQRSGEVVTAMLLDIDHFKNVNDSHGHVVGDAVLQSVAAAVAGELRTGDPLFRIGGDEFMILLPATAPTQAVALADRICAAVATATRAILPNGPVVTASIGVVTVDSGAMGTLGLIERADAALYEAKNAGRDRAVLGAPPTVATVAPTG